MKNDSMVFLTFAYVCLAGAALCLGLVFCNAVAHAVADNLVAAEYGGEY